MRHRGEKKTEGSSTPSVSLPPARVMIDATTITKALFRSIGCDLAKLRRFAGNRLRRT